MGKTAIRMMCAVCFVLLGSVWSHNKKVEAEPQVGFGQSSCVSYVPRAWGTYRGGSQQSGLAFEDAAGTLRFITNVPCESTPQVALEIRRTTPNTSSGN